MFIRLFLLIPFFLFSSQCYFVPPSGWEIAHLKTPSPYVHIGFLGKGSTEFRPSISLATEEVDVSLKEYVKAVKELQLAEPNTKWRDLGKFPMQGGTGQLTEMSNTSPYGELKIFQAFLIKGDTAYILTAAVLKDDLPKFQADLLKSFRSLNVIADLSVPITESSKRKEFQTFFASLGTSDEKEREWEKLQSQVGELSQLGSYWQFLALQEGREKIYPKGK